MILSNTTLNSIEQGLVTRNGYLTRINELVGRRKQYTVTDWTEIKDMITAGTASKRYSIGSQFLSTYKGIPITDGYYTSYTMPWDVVAYLDEVELEDGTKKKGMVLQSHYATVESVQFDAPEPSNSNSNVQSNGYNLYSKSAVRQWLNSDADTGKWWTAQSDTDVAPSQLDSIRGFLKGLDSIFLSGITAIKQQTVWGKDATDTSQIYTTCDKFFLPSVDQMYLEPWLKKYGVEGSYFQYWKDVIGLSSPPHYNVYNSDSTKIYLLNDTSTACECWLRSCSEGSYNGAYCSFQNGGFGNAVVNFEYHCCPACVVVGS